jgi:hypothetical protein
MARGDRNHGNLIAIAYHIARKLDSSPLNAT